MLCLFKDNCFQKTSLQKTNLLQGVGVQKFTFQLGRLSSLPNFYGFCLFRKILTQRRHQLEYIQICHIPWPGFQYTISIPRDL